MKIISIHLINFGIFVDQILNCSNIKLALILGNYENNIRKSNGSGKSILMSAVLYALFGKAGDFRESDFRMIGSKGKMLVEFAFILDDKNYFIRRGRTESGISILEFTVDGHLYKSKKKGDVQDIIKECIPLSHDSLIASNFFRQNASDAFTNADASVRKQYMQNILMLDYYEKASKLAAKKASSLKENIIKLESSLEAADNNLLNTDGIVEKVTTKEKLIKNTEKLFKALKKLNEKRDELNKKIFSLETGDIKELQKEIDTIKIYLVKNDIEIGQKLRKLHADFHQNFGILTSKKKQWELIKDSPEECPTCMQFLDVSFREKIIIKVKSEIDKLKILCNSLDKQVIDLDNELADTIEKKTKNEKAVEERKNLKNKLEKYKENVICIEGINKEIKELDKKILLLSDKDLSVIEKKLSDLKVEYGSLLEKKNNLNKMKKEKIETEDKLKVLRRSFSIFDHLNNIFGKNGIPALIVENAIVSVTEKANEYLKLIDPSKVIKINTLKETQKGKIKESLDLVVEDYFLNTSDNARPYRTFSGGEKNILDFCMHLALSNLLKNRIKANVDFIFLDEVFEKLDEFNLEQMMSALNIVKKEFSQVFVISHKPVKDIFQDKIRIVKTAEGSLIC